MDKDKLLSLAERCEAATGPDRELDVAIGFAIGRIRDRDGNYLFMANNESDCLVESDLGDRELSHYTASLDAAMTLCVRVPESIPSNPRLAAAEALRQLAENV